MIGNEGNGDVDGIGKIIFEERERAGVSQNKLCAGICSVTTLSRLEWGEQNIGKWSIDVFLQRLGKSQDKFWTIVHIGDYEVMELRRSIWNNILYGSRRKAEKGIRQYRESMYIENLHEQFLKKCMGMIAGKRDNDWGKALQLFQDALSITVPEYQIANVEQLLIGRDEMQMILLMVEAYIHLGREETARQLIEGLLENIRQKNWDEEELVKIYPKVVRVYIGLLEKEERYEELVFIAKEAVEMLVDNGIIFLLAELIEKIIWGMEKCREVEKRRFSVGEEQEYTRLKHQAAVLRAVWKEYGSFPEECMLYCTNVQKDISVSNEIIAKCRKLCNLSQEKVSEEVCTVEQFSRIENGKCSPLEKSYRALMEKMNQAQERNRFFVNAQEYSVHEKIRQLEKKMNGLEIRKASVEWEKLKTEIPGDTLNNQQYIARYDAIMRQYNKEIDIKEYIKELEEALRLTMQEFEVADIRNWPLTRGGISLLVNIANAYYMVGRKEEAKRIYYELWHSIVESSVQSIYHETEYRILAYNLGLIEGLECNYEKAVEILESGLESCMRAGRFDMLPSLLHCLGWNIWEEEKVKRVHLNEQKARHILEQAFCLGDLLKRLNICNEICEYYEEEWNEKITSYHIPPIKLG